MKLRDISLPQVYLESADFRFFLKWFESALERIRFDHENLFDLYDPERCPSDLLWLLGDTIGYKYDDRLPVAFNRLVILYFMSMIRNKGSKDGVTLAAEVNLAQFNLIEQAKQKEILSNRLEDTSIPVNSVYVTPHTDKGYIDVVYFSNRIPTDACIEYVRPLGMYVFESAGVRFDSKTKVSIDARLTNTNDVGVSIGPTHVGHYRREDYARLQKMSDEPHQDLNYEHTRNTVWYRNADAEGETNRYTNPGWRALYSLQLCNNENIVKSLIDPIFDIGYTPQTGEEEYKDDGPFHLADYDVGVIPGAQYVYKRYQDKPLWNLRYDKTADQRIGNDVYMLDEARNDHTPIRPYPAVNPVMSSVGDAIQIDTKDSKHGFSEIDDAGNIKFRENK